MTVATRGPALFTPLQLRATLAPARRVQPTCGGPSFREAR
jgi:hypothetical protein